MNAEQLKPKAIKASERFLESRGYEILETSWECAAGGADIIARDDAAVVFVEVNARTGAEAKRAKFERTAIAYMAGYEETDVSVRFDIISMVVIGESRAMLRHHINALSADPA